MRAVEFVLPVSTRLGRRQARALTGAFGLVLAVVAVAVAHVLFGVGGPPLDHVVRNAFAPGLLGLVTVVLMLRALTVSTSRRAWALLAAGVCSYTTAQLLWTLWVSSMHNPPYPSVCDALWLAFYPLSYAAIVDFVRDETGGRVSAGLWLDGLIAGTGLAAIGSAILLPPVLASATGSAAAVTTDLAYPVCDLILGALVLGALGLRGWRLCRTWQLLIGSSLVLVIADCIWELQIAGGATSGSSGDMLLYMVAWTGLAFAAWQHRPAASGRRAEAWSGLVLPALFTCGAIVLLVFDHFHRIDVPALVLSVITLLAVTLRMGLTFREMLSFAEVRRQALTDELTSLPNRRLFMNRLRDAIIAARAGGGGLSVLMLDLDNFKQLNDTLGHHAGDDLLRMVGPRLRRALRSTDTIARLGGDEFAILLDPAPDPAGLARVSAKVLASLRTPFKVKGLALRLGGSVGVASFPLHADDGEELMKCADVAMYEAKRSRRGWELYATERDTNSMERLVLASEFAAALERDGIEAHFQAIADTASRRIAGAEALVRWRRPDGSLLAPAAFLGAAEQAGLSRPLTRRMLDLALGQLQAWRADGHDLYVSVNTTVADLLDVEFPQEVADALTAHGLLPSALVLEITESSVLTDPERIGTVLDRLRKLGVQLSLDDFGTGYSSLAHLRTLAVREVKIDRSFVTHMCEERADAAIVYATIELAHKLGLRAVAEGVEDQATWAALAELGCDRIQGYALSRPVAPTEFARRIIEDPSALSAPPSVAATP